MALDLPYEGPLPCGVAIDDLIAQVTEGAPVLDRAHQAACEFCQAALEAIRRAWEELQELARAIVAVPDDFSERVMTRVRELSAADAAGYVVARHDGRTRVLERVVLQTARAAAREVPGVLWASATPPGAQAGEPEAIAVQLHLVVGWGERMLDLAQTVRMRVIDEVGVRAGVVLDRVDVVVQDVVVADSASA